MSFLNSLRIRTKLLLLILIPLISIILLSSVILHTFYHEEKNNHQLQILTLLANDLSNVIDALQLERNAVSGYLASNLEIFEERLVPAKKLTDEKIKVFFQKYNGYRKQLHIENELQSDLKYLNKLKSIRSKVDHKAISIETAQKYYIDTINTLIYTVKDFCTVNDTPNISRSLRNNVILVLLKESASLERAYVTRILLGNKIYLHQIITLNSYIATQNVLLNSFSSYASSIELSSIKRILNSQEALEVQLIRDKIFRQYVDQSNEQIDVLMWDKIAYEKNHMLKKLENKICNHLVDVMQSQEQLASHKFWALLITIIIVNLFTLLICYLICSNIVRKVLRILNFLVTLDNLNNLHKIKTDKNSKDEMDFISNALYNFVRAVKEMLQNLKHSDVNTYQQSDIKVPYFQETIQEIKQNYISDINRLNQKEENNKKNQIIVQLSKINEQISNLSDYIQELINKIKTHLDENNDQNCLNIFDLNNDHCLAKETYNNVKDVVVKIDNICNDISKAKENYQQTDLDASQKELLLYYTTDKTHNQLFELKQELVNTYNNIKILKETSNKLYTINQNTISNLEKLIEDLKAIDAIVYKLEESSFDSKRKIRNLDVY